MPPSTPALSQTLYTGLNTVLALARNAAATERSQEDFVQRRATQQPDLSPAEMRSDYRIYREKERAASVRIYSISHTPYVSEDLRRCLVSEIRSSLLIARIHVHCSRTLRLGVRC